MVKKLREKRSSDRRIPLAVPRVVYLIRETAWTFISLELLESKCIIRSYVEYPKKNEGSHLTMAHAINSQWLSIDSIHFCAFKMVLTWVQLYARAIVVNWFFHLRHHMFACQCLPFAFRDRGLICFFNRKQMTRPLTNTCIAFQASLSRPFDDSFRFRRK